MSSYANGTWTHPNNCPTCWAVRVSQGFVLYGGTGEECEACKTTRALLAFYSSAEYVAWQTTIPEGLEMVGLSAWLVENPAPTYKEEDWIVKKTEITTFPPTMLDG
jgi:hypothetical protein